MAVSISSNIAALKAQRRLSQGTDTLATVFERLSSGSRINRASDDAAGLSIASSLRADTKVFAQAIKNINDGMSVLHVADGATQELKGVLTRIRELATQSANGTYSDTQRTSLETENNKLQDEYNRILDSTRFNGINPFVHEISIQAGYGTASVLSIDLGTKSQVKVPDGTLVSSSGPYTLSNQSIILEAADVNDDGIIDLVSADQGGDQLGVYLGNGDGTFKARQGYNAGDAPQTISIQDLNGDSFVDLVTTNG